MKITGETYTRRKLQVKMPPLRSVCWHLPKLIPCYTYDPAVVLLGVYQTEMHQKTCTMFIASLFKIAKS